MRINKIIAGLMTLCIAGMACPAMNVIPAEITACASSDYTEGTYENLTYKNYGDYIEISDCEYSVETVEIPAEIDGVPVTGIGNYAFMNCKLTSVTIPDSITKFGNRAFSGCDNLTSIEISDNVTVIGTEVISSCSSLTSINVSANNKYYSSENGVLFNKDKTELIVYPINKGDTEYIIPDSVVSINNDAFSGAKNITSVIIPDSVTSIGENAFYKCYSLKSIEIPNSVTSIQAHTFHECVNMESIVIPDSITDIGNAAFVSCRHLKSLEIPDSVATISENVFYQCVSLASINVSENNQHYMSENGVLFSKDKKTLIKYPQAKTDTEYVIPDSVTTFGDIAFHDCIFLTSITIPDSVTNIGNSVFNSCVNLVSVTIPESVASIGERAFEYCFDLTSVTILNPDCEIYDSERVFSDDTSKNFSGTIYSYDNSTAQAYAEKYGRKFESLGKAPENVGKIKEGTYENLKYKNHGDYIEIFNCDESTETLVIPSEIDGLPVTEIGGFSGCYSLKSVEIPDSVITIKNSAFCDCDSLTSLIIPDSVTTIENSAFDNCDNLASIEIPESVTSIGYDVFIYTQWIEQKRKENPLVVVNDILVDARTCTGDVIIPDGITQITGYAFYNCVDMKSVKIPDSVIGIGIYAFGQCDNIISLDIPEKVKDITERTFADILNIESISVSEHNPYYSSTDGILFNKDKTELIKYPQGNTKTDYSIPESVKNISENAFVSCDNLISVEIPESVTDIGHLALAFCVNLESVKILNPDCVIYDDDSTITNGIDYDNGISLDYTMYGYDNSTAQAYAEKYGINFVSLGQFSAHEISIGDINGDGFIDSVDSSAVLIEYTELSTKNPSTLAEDARERADLNKDGIVDAVDSTIILQYYAYISTKGTDSIEKFISSLDI